MQDRTVSTTANGGVGFFGLLGIAFIVLKLCGVISWSWWWVLSPIWIPVALSVLIFTGIFLWMVFSGKK